FMLCTVFLLTALASSYGQCPSGCSQCCVESAEWATDTRFYQFTTGSVAIDNACDPTPQVLTCPVYEAAQWNVFIGGHPRCPPQLSVGIPTSGSTFVGI